MGLLKMLGLAREPPPRVTDLLQQVSKRAERLDPHQQAGTFVSIGGVESALLNIDNRVIFGRRGTGKTHLLFYVAEAAKKRGEIAVLMDIRTLGSNSYIYNDESLSIADRATRLLRDFVAGLYERLYDQVTQPGSKLDVTRLAPLIEAIGGAVKEVLVRESIERKQVDDVIGNEDRCRH
jgi:predicted NACHT family NTPase